MIGKVRQGARVREEVEDSAERRTEYAIDGVSDGASQGLVMGVPEDSPQVPAGESRLKSPVKVGAQEAQRTRGESERQGGGTADGEQHWCGAQATQGGADGSRVVLAVDRQWHHHDHHSFEQAYA